MGLDMDQTIQVISDTAINVKIFERFRKLSLIFV